MVIERVQKALLTERLETEPRTFIQVLYRHRQVGKTTIAQQFMQTTALPVHFVSADFVAFEQSHWMSQQWEAARVMLQYYNLDVAIVLWCDLVV
mgnify:CR=1 FL=1